MKQITVGKNETCLVPLFVMNDDTPNQYDIVLAEPDASVRVVALILGKNNKTCRIDVNVTHVAPRTTSDVDIRVVLADQASATVEGLATILPGAKGAKTWLGARIVSLSPSAKGEATPSLEILENDVQAGHAATVGRVSEEELFYLMSRGLSRKSARQLIVQGFIKDVIEALPDEMRALVLKEVERL